MNDFHEAVLKAERRRCAAMVMADMITLDTLLLDELRWVHGSGRQDTKQALLTDIAQNKPYEAVDILRHEVKIHGEVAISSGLVSIRTARGAHANLFTNVWLRRNGDIGLAASQSTRAAEQVAQMPAASETS